MDSDFALNVVQDMKRDFSGAKRIFPLMHWRGASSVGIGPLHWAGSAGSWRLASVGDSAARGRGGIYPTLEAQGEWDKFDYHHFSSEF